MRMAVFMTSKKGAYFSGIIYVLRSPNIPLFYYRYFNHDVFLYELLSSALNKSPPLKSRDEQGALMTGTDHYFLEHIGKIV
jgi:hypothetical protein